MSAKSVKDHIKDLVARWLGLSLTNTKPFYINNTNLYSDINGYAIQALGSNVTFTTLNVRNEPNNSQGLVNMTLPKNTIIYVNVKDIELAGGEVIVYKY